MTDSERLKATLLQIADYISQDRERVKALEKRVRKLEGVTPETMTEEDTVAYLTRPS